MGFLSPFRHARRRRLLERSPIPDSLWDWAFREHRIFRWLGPEDQRLLRNFATILLGEKRFTALGGAIIDEELKVSIASQAALPLLGLPGGLDWYRDWSTILVTPREYEVTKRERDDSGVIHEYEDEFAGEAFELGPIALSRIDVEASGWGEGYNVVIHEMAHKLDGLDGEFDGSPPLHAGMDQAAWKAAFSAAFEDFRSRLAAPAKKKPRRGRLKRSGIPRLDPYAAESPDEFFAVACEYFYERPELLASEYPKVFEELRLFFRRDPSA